jgi:hypothetical protein
MRDDPKRLTFVVLDDMPVVIDTNGGSWWPSDEAWQQIDDADDPAAEALRICEESPMRGVWHS